MREGRTCTCRCTCILHFTVSVYTPGEDLVVCILEVPVLLSSDRVYQLVLVKVEHFAQAGQVRAQRHQLRQVQNTAAEHHSACTYTRTHT